MCTAACCRDDLSDNSSPPHASSLQSSRISHRVQIDFVAEDEHNLDFFENKVIGNPPYYYYFFFRTRNNLANIYEIREPFFLISANKYNAQNVKIVFHSLFFSFFSRVSDFSADFSLPLRLTISNLNYWFSIEIKNSNSTIEITGLDRAKRS